MPPPDKVKSCFQVFKLKVLKFSSKIKRSPCSLMTLGGVDGFGVVGSRICDVVVLSRVVVRSVVIEVRGVVVVAGVVVEEMTSIVGHGG